MEEPETITSEHLSDDANHTQCECGNQTIYEYVWSDDNGCNSCPHCMVDWQSQQINKMKELIYELSPKSKEETAKLINKKYAKIMGIEIGDFSDDMDFSKFEE